MLIYDFHFQVCDSQIQFSKSLELPIFGGTRGKEITKSLTEMQDTFQTCIRFEDPTL